jgi:hypothetical protein
MMEDATIFSVRSTTINFELGAVAFIPELSGLSVVANCGWPSEDQHRQCRDRWSSEPGLESVGGAIAAC